MLTTEDRTESAVPAVPAVTVSRVIRAPRERVFDAWVDPDQRRAWWVDEHGSRSTRCEIDARVGGRYRQNQVTPDYEWIMEGEFLEVDRPNRLVFTWNVNYPDDRERGNTVAIDFREVTGGTEITILHEGGATQALRDGQQVGWTHFLGKLAETLEA